MSVVKEWTIFCDAGVVPERCLMQYPEDAGGIWPPITLTELRQAARKDGWLSTATQDLCPQHREGSST